jgi:hypothetical protein
VFDLSGLLVRIPDEFKPLAALAIGAFILVFIALFHGAGLHGILVQQKRIELRLRMERPHVIAALLLFSGTVFLMLLLHLVEVAIWALCLARMGVIVHGYGAIYFCANAYTTLGYGTPDVVPQWENITPIIAMSGLFTFAWTTSSLVAVVAVHRNLIEQLEEEREQEMHMRFALRKDEWDALRKGRDAERSERKKTRADVAGTSFFQRHRMWNEEKKREKEIRKATAVEIKELRAKERQAEEKLGSDPSPIGPADKK